MSINAIIQISPLLMIVVSYNLLLSTFIIIVINTNIILLETNGAVNINSNLIENLPLYSMSLYAQDGSIIYDSHQLEKVSYYLFVY